MTDKIIYDEAVERINSLCEDVLEDCANFADGYDYDYEWVLDTFQEQFSKIKRGYLKNKGCE